MTIAPLIGLPSELAALPHQVFGHGFWLRDDRKISKSAGGAIRVQPLIERFGADAVRYFLLREVGFTNDGDFTWERFDERYTSDLADGLGNLLSITNKPMGKIGNFSLVMAFESGDGAAHRIGRHGMADEVALRLGASEIAEHLQLVNALNSLGNHVETE